MKHPCFATFDNGIVASIPKEHVENMPPEARELLEKIVKTMSEEADKCLKADEKE